MKLLKIQVPLGYKMLSKDFEIDFLAKARVDKSNPDNELIQLAEDFYYPVETIFIGKNSSGKTTTLSLIHLVYAFLRNGRIRNRFLNDGEKFELDIVYYRNNVIYNYHGLFKKDTSINDDCLIIESESLKWAKIKSSLKKDLSNATFFIENDFAQNIGGDTSSINKFQDRNDFNLSIDRLGYSTQYYDLYYSVLKEKAFFALLRLFDDSIESLTPYTEDGKLTGYKFKRVGDSNPIVVKNEYLEDILSAGTLRGINLYGASIMAFKSGGTITIDEIEKSFNRNLIENLLIMFEDQSINKAQASIIFTTHYSELLDKNNRCDNINVLHRTGNTITLSNMRSDYKYRTDMLKSGQFNQNVFDTLINYERLMDLKDAIRSEE